MNYVGQILVFLGALVAVRGDTWHSQRRGWRKVTLTGWLTVGIAVAGFFTATWQSLESSRDAQAMRASLSEANESAKTARDTIVNLKGRLASYQEVISEIKSHSDRQMQVVMTQAVRVEAGRTWRAPNNVYGGSVVEVFFGSGDVVELRYAGRQQPIRRQASNPSRVFVMGKSGMALPWQLANTGSRSFSGKVLVYSTPRSRSEDWSWLEEKLEDFPNRPEVARQH